MKAWWRTLTSRERSVVAMGAAVAFAFIFWLAVWRPLAAANSAMAERIERKAADVAWMRAAAAEARQLATRPAEAGNRGDLSLLALAEQSARGSGLAAGFRRGEPVGEARVRVMFEAVSFDQLVNWLVLLNERYAVHADELSVDRAGEPGLVDARVLLAE